MALTREAIVGALREERDLSQKGVAFTVGESAVEDGYYVVSVRPKRAARSSALDESLEGSRAKWGDELENGGVIKFVDPDNDRLIISPAIGGPPRRDDVLWLFRNDFLGPLIDMWSGPLAAKAKQRLEQSRDATPLQEVRALPAAFDDLRDRQKSAVQAAHHRVALVIGPPGTGKTFTVGATAAYLLTRFPKARLLLVGPTNVAVDTALLSIDDWLERLGRAELRRKMKRLGV